MLTREEDIDVHALRKRDWTISAIARHLGRDRKTIRAYLAGREPGVRASTSEDPFERFGAYCAQRLTDDPHLWAATLFDELLELGYDRSYPTRAHAVSRNLQREADGVLVIDPFVIDTAVTKRLAPPLVTTAPVAPPERLVVPDSRKPSPADLARPRRIRDLTAAKGSPVRTSNSLVYTSDVTSARTGVEEGLTPELLQAIDEVSSQVARSWLATATPEERGEARIERPYVPAGPDAALLTDLSGALNTYYIDDSARRTLREHFWLAVDEQS